MNTDEPAPDNSPASPSIFELEQFASEPDDHGLSLEDLSSAYADLLGRGHDPYQSIVEGQSLPLANTQAEEDQAVLDQVLLDQAAEAEETTDADDACEISPRTIVEAVLFVGHPQNEPMTAAHMASLMRGVRPEEVEELIRELNEAYHAEGCPYWIASAGAGYRMTLRDEFASWRNKFYGRVREARLSQPAVDVLALVAYNQPLSREEIDAIRDKDSGALLAQLVRRGLLRIERRDDAPQVKHYRTTDRFLELFGLGNLSDLPRTQDLDPS